MSYVTQVLDACSPYCGSWVGVIALIGAIKSIIGGLLSALENLNQQYRKDKMGSLKWKHDFLVKWEPSLGSFVYFINLCINKFLVGDILEGKTIKAHREDKISGLHSQKEKAHKKKVTTFSSAEIRPEVRVWNMANWEFSTHASSQIFYGKSRSGDSCIILKTTTLKSSVCFVMISVIGLSMIQIRMVI